MTRDDFLAFAPRHEDPLIISFIEFSRQAGFSSEIEFGFWDFTLFDGDETPALVVKTIRNRVSPAVLSRLVTEPTPMKVLLVEGGTPQLDRLQEQAVFLAATGTGVYVRGLGWRSLPGTPVTDEVTDLKLKLARRWRRREDGTWEKACTKCGELKSPQHYYPSAYKTAKDPYRNICISCWNGPKEAPDAQVEAD